ncbi:unnamed protein product, partial [Effrenium voratum]
APHRAQQEEGPDRSGDYHGLGRRRRRMGRQRRQGRLVPLAADVHEVGQRQGLRQGQRPEGGPGPEVLEIGNLADGTNWKALQEHMNQAGKTTWVECFSGKGNGTGGVSYSTAEERQRTPSPC